MNADKRNEIIWTFQLEGTFKRNALFNMWIANLKNWIHCTCACVRARLCVIHTMLGYDFRYVGCICRNACTWPYCCVPMRTKSPKRRKKALDKLRTRIWMQEWKKMPKWLRYVCTTTYVLCLIRLIELISFSIILRGVHTKIGMGTTPPRINAATTTTTTTTVAKRAATTQIHTFSPYIK